MGTRMAPSYANIFMGKLEQQAINDHHLKPLVWWRFIDDVFLLWTHGEDHLMKFVDHLNNFHSTIKFTTSFSTQHVVFLDTTVSLVGNRIETDLYTKPTDKHQYLDPDSCHPSHCKTSIPFSQALRTAPMKTPHRRDLKN